MPLITMTSGIGCGASFMAAEVSRRLGIPLFDDNGLQERARVMGIDSREIEGIDSRAPGFWSRLLDIKPRVYQELLESVVLDLASEGEGIFLGQGAPFLLQDFDCAFHLRIYSTLSERIRRIMEKDDLSYEAARKAIQKSDADRKGFIRYAFHHDWNDPSLFDLIINRDKMGDESAVEVMVQAARTSGVQACGLKSLEALERLSLGSRVKAVIRKTSLKPEGFHVEVPETGVVRVSGEINPLESKDRLLDAIRSIPGVVSVLSEVGGEKIHDI